MGSCPARFTAPLAAGTDPSPAVSPGRKSHPGITRKVPSGALRPPPPGWTLRSRCAGGWRGKKRLLAFPGAVPGESLKSRLLPALLSSPALPAASFPSHTDRSEGPGWDRAHARCAHPSPVRALGTPLGQPRPMCRGPAFQGQAARIPQELMDTQVPPVVGEAPGKTLSPLGNGVRPPRVVSLPPVPARAEAAPRGPQGLRPRRPRESPRTRTELAGDVSQHVLTGHLDPSNCPASLS